MTHPAHRERRFLAWPGWELIGCTVVLGLGLSLWFYCIYGATDYLTSQHSRRVRIHLDAELSIPLVPAMALVYAAITPMFWLAPFILRSRAELWALTKTAAILVAIAGVCFVLFPAEAAFPRGSNSDGWGTILEWARLPALRYNMVPSLHVTLTVFLTRLYARHAPTAAVFVLWLWAGLMILSTLLTHQHHLLDVITGFLLGWFGEKWFYRPAASDEMLPPSPSPDRAPSA